MGSGHQMTGVCSAIFHRIVSFHSIYLFPRERLPPRLQVENPAPSGGTGHDRLANPEVGPGQLLLSGTIFVQSRPSTFSAI